MTRPLVSVLPLLLACTYAVDDSPSSSGMPRAYPTAEAQVAAQAPELVDANGEMALPESCQGLIGASDELGAEEQDDGSARMLFMQATEAFAVADYAGALIGFCETYRLSNRPAILFNVAVTLERVGMPAPAAAFYDEFATLGEPGMGEESRRRADALRQGLSEP